MLDQKKLSIFALLIFGLMGSVVSCSSVLAEDQSDPNFKSNYVEYLKQLPPLTALNGGQSEKIRASFPNHRFPFTVWKIDIKSKNQFSFKPGDSLELKADLSYEFKGQENAKKLQEACLGLNDNQEDACKLPQLFGVSEFKNLGVVAQIWRKDEGENSNKGDYLIDEFYALSDGSAKDKEKLPFSVKWKVPNKIKDGDYYLLLFANQNKYFDLLGNPLTIFSEGERFDFGVEGNEGGLELDKSAIKINGADYAYRAPAPSITGESVNVELPLKNLGFKEETAQVKYEIYRWGRTNPKDLIEVKNENKKIAAGGQEMLNYVFKLNDTDSVYDLKISAESDSSKTVAYARFIANGKGRGIIRFLSVIDENGQPKPYFCIRNANWEGKFKGKIRLTANNQVFMEEEGTLNAEEENCFVAKNSLPANVCQRLNLEVVDQNGNATDRQSIESGVCDGNVANEIKAPDNKKNNFLLMGIAGVLVLLSLGGILILKNKAK